MTASIPRVQEDAEVAVAGSTSVGDRSHGSTAPRLRSMKEVLARGAATSFVVRAGGMLTSFIVQAILARALGASEYGSYIYALAWMNVLLLVATLVFEVSGVRFIGAYLGTGAWGLLAGFLRRSSQLVLGASLLLATLGGVAVWIASRWIPAELTYALWGACVLLVPSALLTIQGAYLVAFKRLFEGQMPFQLLRPLLFAGVLGLSIAAQVPLEAWHASVFNVLATTVALALSTRYLLRAIPDAARGVRPLFETRGWLDSTRAFLMLTLAQFIVGTQTDVLFVGTLRSASEAALYGTAAQVAALLNFGAMAVTAVAMPYVAEHHARGEKASVQRILVGLAWANLAITVPLMLGIAVAGKRVLALFGTSFVAAYPALVVLGLSALVVASVGATAGFVLGIIGREKQAARMVGMTAVLNLVLTAALTPRFGIVGTACATLLATTIRCVMCVRAARDAGVDIIDFRLSTLLVLVRSGTRAV